MHDYDKLSPEEQAKIRAIWATKMHEVRNALRLDLILLKEGREVVELDESGRVTVKTPLNFLR